MSIPIRIAVCIDFDDGSQHEHEVRAPGTEILPHALWLETVVPASEAQRLRQERERRLAVEKLVQIEALAREVFPSAGHTDFGGGRQDMADQILRIITGGQE